ncbi:RagB/SusD family nutrient uptake outer membrane protein [Limibacter armeniacum]|uniref:RagB/SusD family nutrient uptake outer membrane protein n=1 Tax=Limibacter armeniacum TaxID=466084 RepID=UPI002FE56812
MKMNKYILGAFLLSATLSSCNLDTEPEQQIEVDEIQDVPGQVRGLYNLTQAVAYYGRNYTLYGDMGTDSYVWVNGSRFILEYEMNKNVSISESDDDRTIFARAYQVITNANRIIENPEANKDEKGQAYFMRALAHFDLFRLYGEIPLILTVADADRSNYPANATEENIYNQVIDDLKVAKANIVNKDVSYATANAASALLSRVYLYKGDYQEVINEADSILASGSYSLTAGEDLFEYFNKTGGKETIFEIVFTENQTAGSNNFGYIAMSSVAGGYGSYAVNPEFVNSFNRIDKDGFADARGTVGLATKDATDEAMFIVEGEWNKDKDSLFVSKPGFIYNNKFHAQDEVLGLHSPKVLRLAEVLFNKAEAIIALRGEGDQDVIDIIESIRTARYIRPVQGINEDAIAYQTRLDAYNAALVNGGTLAELLEEKRKDFAFEGHRMYDLRRNSLPVTVKEVEHAKQAEGVDYVSVGKDGEFIQTTYEVKDLVTVPAGGHQFWRPIPENEQLANPNLHQNFAEYGN